ncbi:Uncharacterized protein Fot_33442 [Forsythia ovata]|uniref:Uncharacterized protein n=1 Tax=Forsythia ovata TaxID=205694 RepID=A0ABD1TB43_9LAMI
MQRTLFPTTANAKPLSNIVSVYSGAVENSPIAFIKKLASTKHPSAIELHKKLTNRKIEVDPNFSTRILSDFDPKKLLLNRWLAFNALFVRAAKDTMMIIVIEAITLTDEEEAPKMIVKFEEAMSFVNEIHLSRKLWKHVFVSLGAWLSDLCIKMYEVREKKTSKNLRDYTRIVRRKVTIQEGVLPYGDLPDNCAGNEINEVNTNQSLMQRGVHADILGKIQEKPIRPTSSRPNEVAFNGK